MSENTRTTLERANRIREIGDGYKKLAEGFSKVAAFYRSPDEYAKLFNDCEKSEKTYKNISDRLRTIAEGHYNIAKNLENIA